MVKNIANMNDKTERGSGMEIRELRYFFWRWLGKRILRGRQSICISHSHLCPGSLWIWKKAGGSSLIRGKRKVTLTEDGVLLRKRAEEIIELVEKTEQEISTDSGRESWILIWAAVRRLRYCVSRQNFAGNVRACIFIFSAAMPWMCRNG